MISSVHEQAFETVDKSKVKIDKKKIEVIKKKK